MREVLLLLLFVHWSCGWTARYENAKTSTHAVNAVDLTKSAVSFVLEDILQLVRRTGYLFAAAALEHIVCLQRAICNQI